MTLTDLQPRKGTFHVSLYLTPVYVRRTPSPQGEQTEITEVVTIIKFALVTGETYRTHTTDFVVSQPTAPLLYVLVFFDIDSRSGLVSVWTVVFLFNGYR